ncbi:MAG: hypothetical protein ABI867_07590, partial [Kofleriaceae bacterium]
MRLAILFVFLLGSTASARPDRDGANHHLGDDSWVARFGHAPTAADSETERMHVHLAYVHDLLAARAATHPALAARRTELLGYLADYLAKGTTPQNTYVARRNPVFIDRDGQICAVGYLIERSAGRALAETIAKAHRLDYLEDIAAAMPEVAAWVDASGFTLAELASIQPGYMGPEVEHLEGWFSGNTDNLQYTQTDSKLTSGAFSHSFEGATMTGTFRRNQMTGTWKHVLDDKGTVLGSGTFANGAGAWKSVRIDGSRMAEGAFVDSRPHGTWRFFHASGRLAATGVMRRGKRHGTWTFFYDSKGSAKLAAVQFSKGFTVSGTHFDPKGKLVATGRNAGLGLTLAIAATTTGVRHEINQGIPAASYRLDGFALGKDRLYVRNGEVVYDGSGRRLAKV